MLLKDKVAPITGGTGLNGLGFATARQMASHGARVVPLDLAGARPAAAAAAAQSRSTRLATIPSAAHAPRRLRPGKAGALAVD